MKTLISVILFLSASLVYSQTIPDSTQTKEKKQEREQVQNQNKELKQAQDEIGPKGNLQTEAKQNRKGKDVFVDKDGDGICDSRQSGMSFTKMRKRMGSGKSGPRNGNSGGSGNSSTNQNGNSNSGSSK